MSFITLALNKSFVLIGAAIAGLLALLPSSPFAWNLDGTSTALTWLFWLVPIPAMVTSINAYVTAVALYYAIRIALKWIKIAGS